MRKKQPCVVDALRVFMKILESSETLGEAKSKTKSLALNIVFKEKVEP